MRKTMKATALGGLLAFALAAPGAIVDTREAGDHPTDSDGITTATAVYDPPEPASPGDEEGWDLIWQAG